eukprot:TRINITY_DN39327_c0_g1_i1.p1 TRINITY_DN39327_c0_g1~~TRINITY_DN39327_c0_g1_i1.p1  ORF type:complete len:150 (-),score=37.28 TRINITY_DN39327_c0_g1_i1:1169-1618(-)
MAALRAIVTGTSSASLEEARIRSLDFFREVCRALPSIMDRFILDEVTTLAEMRSKVAIEFRKHAGVTNPKVVDMLVYKGQEELENYLSHSKQRHHILSEWIVGPIGQQAAGHVHTVAPPKPGLVSHRVGIVASPQQSEFLRRFYESNEN